MQPDPCREKMGRRRLRDAGCCTRVDHNHAFCIFLFGRDSLSGRSGPDEGELRSGARHRRMVGQRLLKRAQLKDRPAHGFRTGWQWQAPGFSRLASGLIGRMMGQGVGEAVEGSAAPASGEASLPVWDRKRWSGRRRPSLFWAGGLCVRPAARARLCAICGRPACVSRQAGRANDGAPGRGTDD